MIHTHQQQVELSQVRLKESEVTGFDAFVLKRALKIENDNHFNEKLGLSFSNLSIYYFLLLDSPKYRFYAKLHSKNRFLFTVTY